MVVVDGYLLDEFADEAFVELGDAGLLFFDETLQLLNPVHGFFPVVAIDFGLLLLVSAPENLVSFYC